MRIMALDLGTKRIGVALSDELKLLARPLEIIEIKSSDATLKRIKELVSANKVEKIVIGMPVNMDGSMGEKAKEAKEFADNLKANLNIEVDFYDERLSTVQASNVLIDAGISRKKRKTITDKLAAQFVLQAYLDMKRKN